MLQDNQNTGDRASKLRVFVEAERIASDFAFTPSLQNLKPLSLDGLLTPAQIHTQKQWLRGLDANKYASEVVAPTEHPKRKSAPEVIKQFQAIILREITEGPFYLAELEFDWPTYPRRVVVIAQDKRSNNGSWEPLHHRLAESWVRFYGAHNIPIITFVDTPGADSGENANLNNQAHSISSLIATMQSIPVPSVGLIFGQAYSGGAIPLVSTSLLLAVKDGIFNTIHPQSLSDIAYHYNLSWQECAQQIGLSSYELHQAQYIDGIINYSPLGDDNPRILQSTLCAALEWIEQESSTFLQDSKHHYFFDYHQNSTLNALRIQQQARMSGSANDEDVQEQLKMSPKDNTISHPTSVWRSWLPLLISSHHTGKALPQDSSHAHWVESRISVQGMVTRFLRHLRHRRRLKNQPVERYSRLNTVVTQQTQLKQTESELQQEKFKNWLEQPREIRYESLLHQRCNQFLEAGRMRFDERGRFMSLLRGDPEANLEKRTGQLCMELALSLYNFWKQNSSKFLPLLLQYLEQTTPKSSSFVKDSHSLTPVYITDLLYIPELKSPLIGYLQNILLFDRLYDKILDNLPTIAGELKATNSIQAKTLSELLNVAFSQAAGLGTLLESGVEQPSSHDVSAQPVAANQQTFSAFLGHFLKRPAIEKEIQQISMWKRDAFPRMSEPLFGVIAHIFSHLLPSYYAAQAAGKPYQGKINPRHIGIKDFWNRLSDAYKDLLIDTLLLKHKKATPITPQHLLDVVCEDFMETSRQLITSDPAQFPGFRASMEKALQKNILPVGVITGFATFKHQHLSRRIGIVVSNTLFQAGAFDMASGEKICQLMAECAANHLPLVFFISSGGMQTKEGPGALFSMAVLNARITRFVNDFQLPIVCIGFRDCTGGSQASFMTHPSVNTFYLSGSVIPFAGKRVVPSYLSTQSTLANYLSEIPGSMEALLKNPFDNDLDEQLQDIDPDIPIPSLSIKEAIAKVLQGGGQALGDSDKKEKIVSLGLISFAPVKKVLIHARGATAVRLIQGAHTSNAQVVLVQSDCDMDSRSARLLKEADQLICLGGDTPQESYLNAMSVIRIAQQEQVDALHPGIGFLSENADFALLCRKHGFNFIGPRASTMGQIGNKSNAIAAVLKAGGSVVPGSNGVVPTVEQARIVAKTIGYPLLLKAAFGGGGKGIRILSEASQLESAFAATTQEAEAAFGNGDLYMEKCITSMRHVEAQLLRDRSGNTKVLGIRDCTVQRNGQKLVEESGSTLLPNALKQQLMEETTRIANTVDYIGAGTVEFIYDLNAEQIYFMEMNARLQVEHPVTEMVSGIDIVNTQFDIASGKRIDQLVSASDGYAIEVRINAEHLQLDAEGAPRFVPSPGKMLNFILPEQAGIRVIAAVETDDEIPPFYDSLIAQVIAHGTDRQSVITLLIDYLQQVTVEGIYTNITLLEHVLSDTVFQSGEYDTGFLEQYFSRADLDLLMAESEKRHHIGDSSTKRYLQAIPDSDEFKVLAPRSGVFYVSSTPEDPPFVPEGTSCTMKEPICLLEAMKVFEQLTLRDFITQASAEWSDPDQRVEVKRVFAQNGQRVNQGDLLFVVIPLKTN